MIALPVIDPTPQERVRLHERRIAELRKALRKVDLDRLHHDREYETRVDRLMWAIQRQKALLLEATGDLMSPAYIQRASQGAL